MAAVLGRGLRKGVDNIGGDNEERKCFQSPFIAYYVAVISLNTVAIIGGAVSQFDLHRGQAVWFGYDRCDAWLLMNGIFGVIHIVGAVYLVRKIQQPEKQNAGVSSDYQLQNQYAKTADGKSWPSSEPVVQAEPVGASGWANENGNGQKQKIISPNAQKSIGPPESWERIKHVLMENVAVAVYFVVYLIYLVWHFLFEMYPCNQGMMFLMRSADTFILAAPCSFFFSVITMIMKNREEANYNLV